MISGLLTIIGFCLFMYVLSVLICWAFLNYYDTPFMDCLTFRQYTYHDSKYWTTDRYYKYRKKYK